MKKESQTPIYLKLRDELANLIKSGKIGVGERLSSERNLATEMGVARETVRDALRMLEGEGLIYSKKGSGYFVSHARWSYDPTHHVHQSRLIRDFGFTPGILDLKRSLRKASAWLAQMLECPQGTPVYLHNCIALQDGRKVCYEETYLLESAFPDFLDIEFEPPLTNFLAEHFNVQAEQVGFRARPTNLTGKVAAGLGVRTGTPGLFITRIKTKNGVPVWVDREYWLADVLEIVIGRFPQKPTQQPT